MGKVIVLHERWKCIGCGACAAVNPDNWEMMDDGKSDLKGGKVEKEETSEGELQKLELDEIGQNQEAADSCPVNCIHVKKKIKN